MLVLSAFVSIEAQTQGIEALTIADGLSQGMIYDILQSDDGFLWFATKDGLNRYDGYNFEVFTNDPFNPYSIGGNDIKDLFEDSRGNLWITLFGGGCDVLEKTSGRFLHMVDHAEIQGILSIKSVVETPDSTIWIGTENGLLKARWQIAPGETASESDLHASVKVETAKRHGQPGNEDFHSLYANRDGSLHVFVRDDGIYHFDPVRDTLQLLYKETFSGRALFLGETSPGKLWFTYTSEKKNVFLIEDKQVREIQNWETQPYFAAGVHPYKDNILWSTRAGRQTFIYSIAEADPVQDGSLGTPDLIAQFDMQCASMELDAGDNLWIGTSGYGLRKIKLSKQPFQHKLKGLSIRRVLSTDEIYMWMAGSSAVWQLNDTADRVMPIPRLPTDVFQFYQTRNGGAYFITRFDEHYFLKDASATPGEPRTPDFSAHEYSPITEDGEGNIWVGGVDAYVMRFEPTTGRITRMDLSPELGKGAVVYALHIDSGQNIWIGTTNGIAQFNLQEVVFEQNSGMIRHAKPAIYQTDEKNPASLRYNFVTSFCDDPHFPDRFLWVSTKGGGLNLLDKEAHTFRHFTNQNSGLPNDVVYGILPDENGNLWMSTNRGLSRVTCLPSFYEKSNSTRSSGPQTADITFQNFRETDGLQSDEFNTSAFYKHSDGRLMFGGVNGLTIFYPSEIKERESNAPVRLTRLRINNLDVDYFENGSVLGKPVHLTDEIILHYTQNLVTLDFALMDFVTPQQNRFRYRLHGVDPDWVEAGTVHTANYAQLRPGQYTFEVQGNIGYGPWSPPTFLKITVLPPWWATWWAYSLYALLVAASLIAVFQFFRKRLQLQHALKLEQEEANRLKDLDTFKSQLFTNLTHEFRTPLTVILGMSHHLETGSWQDAVTGKEKSRISNALTLIGNNGRNLLRLINQLLDLSKLENKSFRLHLKQGDIVSYLRYVTESFQSYANGNNLSLRFFTTTESLMMDFDAEQIKQVMTNLISNAMKFTPSGGEIQVKLSVSSGNLGIHVIDTGIGILPKDLPYIFDRFYQADSSSTRSVQGTGIGLAHTQELVKIMGGTISVESEPGKGTTIFIQLPVRHDHPVDQSRELPDAARNVVLAGLPTTSPGDDDPQENGQTLPDSLPLLLIIEDNPDVVVYLRACLEDAYHIVVAYNGRIGIEKALESIPDIIISDVMMPEKDGYEVCDTLKNDVRTSHIPLILLTAKADAVSRLTGLRRGADAYLAKPFDQAELRLQLTVLLENRRRMAAHFSRSLHNGQAAPEKDAMLAEVILIEDAFVNKVKSIIDAHYTDENFGLPQLCQLIGMSRSQLFRKMKAVTDTSASDLIRSHRLNKAKALLESGNMSVAEATYHVGFKDPSYFSKLFQEEFGVQPSSIAK